jgi:hypothetical protein
MFAPVLPIGGLGGWALLNRTIDRQQAQFARSPEVKRDLAHFRETIGKVKSAQELVSDRRLLRVALGAFGLQDDLQNRAFIQRVLESPKDDPRALANRIADRRYGELARAFGFGEPGGPTFLGPSLAEQRAAFRMPDDWAADLRYFRSNIRNVETAQDLVSDPRLLRVALGAFGLEDRADRPGFVKAVLESNAADPSAIVNRLSDPRLRELAEAFNLGGPGRPRTLLAGFADRIAERLETRLFEANATPQDPGAFAERLISAFVSRQFEVAVGTVNPDMRLALNVRRELAEIAGRDGSERGKWLAVLGQPPLRQVFETAFGLPREFGTLDVDRQADVLQARTRRTLGAQSFGDLANPERIEALVRQFLVRAEAQAGPAMTGAGSVALQLLSVGLPPRF